MSYHPGQWLPIETAPKDGTCILVAGRHDRPHVAAWSLRRTRWVSQGCDGPAISGQSDFGTDYQEPGPLTHWMPLPDPPSSETG